MSFIFNINEELASIAVTSTELRSTSKAIVSLVRKKEFIQKFSKIISEINKSYRVIETSFSPFCELDTQIKFADNFPKQYEVFKKNYLMEIAKPRKYCDNVYSSYIEMTQTKEAKTSFPLIKKNFVRLDKLYDKWMNNDVYLAMSIDRAIKIENNFLNEILGLKESDIEDAFFVFSSAFEDFGDYLKIIEKNSREITQLFVDV